MTFTFLGPGLFWRETNMAISDIGISSQRLAGGFFYHSSYSMIYLHHNCMELDLLGGLLLELCIKCLLHQRLINMQDQDAGHRSACWCWFTQPISITHWIMHPCGWLNQHNIWMKPYWSSSCLVFLCSQSKLKPSFMPLATAYCESTLNYRH